MQSLCSRQLLQRALTLCCLVAMFCGLALSLKARPGFVQTEWGSHTLSQATRRLLQAALENPLNQRFVLMCGSSIPLRPVVFTYSQLIAEKRSRFDGYGFTRDDDQEVSTPRTSQKLMHILHLSRKPGS